MNKNKLENIAVVHITTGSAKMLHVNSINTPTTGNPFCEKMKLTDSICARCYARNYEKMRPAVPQATARNQFMTERALRPREIPVINQQIFRFHSYGELHNAQHLENYFAIANHNPQTTFTLWTKRKDIVQAVLKHAVKPTNIILIYSSPLIDTISRKPKGFDKVFTAHKKDTDVAINCHGSCNDCRLCYSHNEISFINEVVK